MKRFTVLLIALCIIASIGLAPAAAEEKLPEGDPWVNSDLYGAWPAERPAPEEQFALWANYDFYMDALERNERSTSNHYTRFGKLLRERILEMCTDPGKTDAESECLRLLYSFYMDRESIAKDGFSSLMGYVDRVKAVETIDGLTALMEEEGFLFGTPFFRCDFSIMISDVRKIHLSIDRRCVINEIYPEDDEYETDPLPEPKKDTEEACRKLVRMGYTREEASRLAEKILLIEDPALDEVQYTNLEATLVNKPVKSYEDIRKICPALAAILKGQGYVREGTETEEIFGTSPEVENFSQLYTQENLDALKAVIALSLYDTAKEYLGHAAFPEAEEETDPLAFCRHLPIELIPQAYMHRYIPGERADEFHRLFNDLREAMRVRIAQCIWASPETKEMALKKLDMMETATLIFPLESDFEPLRTGLTSCSSLLEAAAQSILFQRRSDSRYGGMETSRGNRRLTSEETLSLNSAYTPGQNVLYIGIAALTGEMYNDASRETLLASIGFHIAHEISHGFDTVGVMHDGIGAQDPVLTEEDMQAFTEKADALVQRAGRIRLLDGLYVQGSHQINEIIADTQGLRLVLDLAEKEDGFDYDLLFRTYAQFYNWYYSSPEEYTNTYLYDVHPAPFVRVNFTVQMMDEFYDTYPSVTEGTPMYLPPEERPTIW